jgi:hypothetical protein
MAIICEDYKQLLDSYTRTITNHNILFRITKCCGYSQLVTVPCNKSYQYNGPILVNLLEQINLQVGEWARNKVVYYSKITDNMVVCEPKYIHREDLFQPLSVFALSNLQTAYSVNDCQYTVYQLYLEPDCNHSCQCLPSIDFSTEVQIPETEQESSSSSSSSQYQYNTNTENLDYVV